MINLVPIFGVSFKQNVYLNGTKSDKGSFDVFLRLLSYLENACYGINVRRHKVNVHHSVILVPKDLDGDGHGKQCHLRKLDH